jgi:Flp pilus assembly protein TadB
MFSGIMKKGIIALIGMIVALVFIIVALIGPWYSVGFKYSGANENVDFSLTRAKGTMLGI